MSTFLRKLIMFIINKMVYSLVLMSAALVIGQAKAENNIYQLNFKEKSLVGILESIDMACLKGGGEGFLFDRKIENKTIYDVIRDFEQNSLSANRKYKTGAYIRFSPVSINENSDGVYFEFDTSDRDRIEKLDFQAEWGDALVSSGLAIGNRARDQSIEERYKRYDMNFDKKVFLRQGYRSYAENFSEKEAWLYCSLRKGKYRYQFYDCIPVIEKYRLEAIYPIQSYLSKEANSEKGFAPLLKLLILAEVLPVDSSCFKSPLNIENCARSIGSIANKDNDLKKAAEKARLKLLNHGYKLK